MESLYQLKPLFEQAHVLLFRILSLHRATSYSLPQQSCLFLVLGAPQQPGLLVTHLPAAAAAATSKRLQSKCCNISQGGTAQPLHLLPLHLLQLSSRFSHHLQSCKGSSYLFIFGVCVCVCVAVGGDCSSTPPPYRYPGTCRSLLYPGKGPSNLFFRYSLQGHRPSSLLSRPLG